MSHHLPLSSLDMFVFNLEELLEKSKKTVLTLPFAVNDASEYQAAHGIADLLVLRYKDTLTRLTEQLNFWRALSLTDAEREAIDYSQSLIDELYQFQQIFECYEPLFSTSLHR